MMKKNLFLLVSFYFFVLQAIFVGLLRGEPSFYRLAMINFIFIAFISFFSKENKLPKREIDTEFFSVKEESIEKTEKLQKAHKVNKIQSPKIYKPISHIWLFIISILFGFFVWFWLGGVLLSLQLLISVAGSFVLFIIFSFLFKFTFKKVRETKIYLIILIGLALWSFILLANFDKIRMEVSNLFGYITEQFTSLSNVDLDSNINTGSNTKNNTGSGLIFISVSNETIDTGKDLVFVDETESNQLDVDLTVKATFDDVIKALIDKNNIILNNKKNIKFSQVSTSSEDYPYYRTAYDKQMIGKTVNPNKNLLCETYIVMKGLIQKRSVGPYNDIKKAYWAYAKSNDDLPTCEYGDFVTIGDLK